MVREVVKVKKLFSSSDHFPYEWINRIRIYVNYPLPPLKFTILLKHFDFVFYWKNRFHLDLVSFIVVHVSKDYLGSA